MNIALKVKECTSGSDVIENRKEVLARIKAWKQPMQPRLVEIVEQVEKETTIAIQRVALPTVPDSNVNSVEEKHYPTIAQIVQVVCRRYGIAEIDIMSQRRTINVTRPRQIIMYLARHLTLQTTTLIGRKLGDRDHTTILHGVKKIAHYRSINANLDAELTELETVLRATA